MSSSGPSGSTSMSSVTRVTSSDVVIDLGSGNGITVITAAKKGATAIGVEFNPDMVALARKLAAEAGVGNKATFIQGDLFEADLSKATVITLFLLPDINLKLRPKLLEVFPAALLGRLVVVPYLPLSEEVLGRIIRLQLDRIARRVADQHAVPFTYDDSVVALTRKRCSEVESGGRMIDAILTQTLLPDVSREILKRRREGAAVEAIAVGTEADRFVYRFERMEAT